MYTSSELALLRAMDSSTDIPGVDTSVGDLLSTPSLVAVTTLSTNPYAGIRYIPSENELVITEAGAVLSGYNFGNTTVVIAANDVTIKDSTFKASGKELFCVRQYTGFSGAVVEDNTFTGGSSGNDLPLQSFVFSQGTSISVLDNSMTNACGDAIDAWGGTISGNYISGGGWSSVGTHPDGIWITNTKSPTVISDNFIDWTWANGATNNGTGETNNAVRITTEQGNVDNVSVTNNVLLGGGYTIDAGNAGKGIFSNINISNNYIGFGAFGNYMYGPQNGVTETNNTIVDFYNPIYSSEAWTAYDALTLSTDHLIVAKSSANIIGASTGSSTLYGSGTAEHMTGTANETIFIGGAGKQWMWGGSGANIYRYLAFSDSQPLAPDGIGNFDVTKDVIDLSRIDANPGLAGLQNLQFIGTGSFTSAGGQVRVVQDVSHKTTEVEATMAGSTIVMFQVDLTGLLNLTAANFDLNATEDSILNKDSSTVGTNGKVTSSTAFLTDGSSQVRTYNSNGSYEITQYDTTGKSVSVTDYSKSGAILPSTTVGTSALKLLSTSVSVAEGSSLLTQNGVESFGAAAHPNQVADVHCQTGETYDFAQGFGHVTLSGFLGSADTLHLDAAMFGYLTPAMSQARDFAAVLGHSSVSASGLTIHDSYGDSLTITHGRVATLSADSSNIKFT